MDSSRKAPAPYKCIAVLLLTTVLASVSLCAQEVQDSLRRDSLSSAPFQSIIPVDGGVELQEAEIDIVSSLSTPYANDTITMPIPSVPPEYILPYYINPSPLFRGDYSTGGVILSGRHSLLYGSGNRSTLPGLGVQTEAGLTYVRQLSDRLYLQATVNATKLNMMHMTRIAAMAGGSLTYQAQDHLWFNVFGGKGVGSFPNWADWHYGGTVGFDLGERFSLELGVQRYYDRSTGRWTTLPVVTPTINFKDKLRLGLDVGPIIYEIIRRAVNRKDNFRGSPTIRPDIPGYTGGALNK